MAKINLDKVHKFYSEAYICARRNDKSMNKAYSYFVEESVNSPYVAEIYADFLKSNIKTGFFKNVVDRANVEGLNIIFKHFKSNIVGSLNMFSLKSKGINKRKLDDAYNNLYPRTALLRKHIIKKKQVVYGQILPVSNRNFVERLVCGILLKS